MCWTLRCVLYTGYAAWQIKRIRTYIRRGMVYSRFAAAAFQRLPKPKPISRIPISLLPSPFNHVFALFPPYPLYLFLFTPTTAPFIRPSLQEKRSCTLSPFSVSLSLFAMLFLFISVSSYYIDIIFN